ncbi:MAG: HEAT repeat domain-containing protein [Phycisphaerae bacterium]|nr:HEAT repeat domain-containing protein [Phycisphaerae bacterium]
MRGRTIGILGFAATVLCIAGAVRAQQAEEKGDRSTDSESAYLERLKEVRLIEIRHLRSGDAKEFEAGRTRILAIEDDAAVGPLVHVLYGPNEQYRGLLIEALGRHAARGSAAARAYLQEIAVGDSSHSHRGRAVKALQANRSSLAPAPTERLLAHLALDEVDVLRDRAAEALAAMDEKRAVWLLAERLVTVEYRLVGAEVADYSMMLDIRGQWAGVPVFRRVAIQAAVPGGVATTFIELPQVQIVDFATTIAMTERHIGPDYQRVEVRHPQILAALKKLTGKDFGYDVKAWQRWLDTQPQDIPPWEPIRFKAESEPVSGSE